MGMGTLRIVLRLSILAAFAYSVPAAEKRGVVTNICSSPPMEFDFSALPDSCEIRACPLATEADVVLKGAFLTAKGGVLDLGSWDGELFDLEITVPADGYHDSVPFRQRALYAVAMGDGAYALLAETRGIVAGCLHWEFRWRTHDSSNRFAGGPTMKIGARRKPERAAGEMPAYNPAGRKWEERDRRRPGRGVSFTMPKRP